MDPITFPTERGLFYGGQWHAPLQGDSRRSISPATGEDFGAVAIGGPEDMDAAIAAARTAFPAWRDLTPRARGLYLRQAAQVLRDNKTELARLDAAESGNPFAAMLKDVDIAADSLDYFAGLAAETKGESIPLGPDAVNFTVREPLGVVGRIVAFNHPLMFFGAKMGAPLAAGNTVVIKPAEQAPLSSLRFMELIEGLFPPGVVNLVNGGVDAGRHLVGHADVAMVGLIGSVPTGRAVMSTAARTIKPVMLELGGKNALIACPDVEIETVARGIVAGMNFAWGGQSCGSTSRALIHADIHDAVLDRVAELVEAFVPGDPTDPATTMGALISADQRDRVLHYIATGKAEGARLVTGGQALDGPVPGQGNFVAPTIFADVTPQMTIAREEIFGPVLSVIRWQDEDEAMRIANDVEYGLTCSIWTRDLVRAHRLARKAEAGFVWVNKAGPHFLGAPFGGVKQSGIGREECLGELLAFTREKNIHIALA
ncbi:NAD-dependent succinate-semialdehyde dehydrogenase (plasmid) [Antarctobacter heliothermus]|uniref:NAD-dependent succinate-semialdehyde dehydrogenase n=1 Tax=Antarctobacter heliothermus TaxID=74033 RepID=A0A222EC66_9RHOB|nr:aldehyde dehydrogenase family protein [Antarctobacter heliothermus]ASP23658.1 NAD-dependent succinate-semialdehyde dehydrogenase [Antarctobacter heliothermus]